MECEIIWAEVEQGGYGGIWRELGALDGGEEVTLLESRLLT